MSRIYGMREDRTRGDWVQCVQTREWADGYGPKGRVGNWRPRMVPRRLRRILRRWWRRLDLYAASRKAVTP